MMKRLIAIFTALSLFCASFIYASAVQQSSAVNVEKLQYLGLVEETANLNDTVTRGQFAVMMLYFTGNSYALDTRYPTTPFIDVATDSQYAAAVKFLADSGYIIGSGSYRFEPDRVITCSEAATIIVRMLGYTPADTAGGYIGIAAGLGILDGLDSSNVNMTVKDIYAMFENTLEASVLVRNYTLDSYELTRGGSFLEEYHNIYEYTGIVDATTSMSTTDADGLDDEFKISVNGKVYDTKANVWEKYFGYSVTYWVYEYGGEEVILYMEADSANDLTEINVDDIQAISNTEIKYFDSQGKERSEKYDNPYVIYNHELTAGYGKLEYLLPSQGSVVLLSNDGDSRPDIIFIYAYRNAWVKSVDSDDFIVYTYNTEDDIDLTDARIYDTKGNALTFADITVGDILTVEESKAAGSTNDIVVYVSRTKITGSVESQSDDVYTISGKDYELADDFYGQISVGMNATFYLDAYGSIAASEKNVSADGFLYGVLNAIAENDAFGGIKMNIFTTDAEFIAFECNERFKINDISYTAGDLELVKAKLPAGSLIRYKLNADNKLTELQIEDGIYDGFKTLNEGTSFRYRNYVFSGIFAMRPGAVMFGIPTDAANKDEYYVLTDSDYTLGEVMNYSYKAYKVPQNGIELADAVVVYDMSGSHEASNDTPMMLINQVTNVYSEEYGDRPCIKGYQDGKEVSYVFGEEALVQKGIYNKGITLTRGDIILPVTNKKGMLIGCDEIYDIDGKNTSARLIPYDTVDTLKSKFDTENKWIYAVIKETDSQYISYETRLGTEADYTATPGIVIHNTNSFVIRFSKDNYTWTKKESVDALKEGDIVVMHHSTGKVRQICVIGEE